MASKRYLHLYLIVSLVLLLSATSTHLRAQGADASKGQLGAGRDGPGQSATEPAAEDLQTLLKRVKELDGAGNNSGATAALENFVERQGGKSGTYHPDLTGAVAHLAFRYSDEGRDDDALELARTALAMKEKALGPNSSELAGSHMLLGRLLGAAGRHEEAVLQHQRGMALIEEHHGRESPRLIVPLYWYGDHLLEERRRFSDAADVLERALAIQEATNFPYWPHLSRIVQKLAQSYDRDGRYVQAVAAYKRVVEIERAEEGENSESVAQAFDALAVYLKKNSMFAEAEAAIRGSLKIREVKLPPSDHRFQKYARDLSEVLTRQNRPSEAAAFLERAIANAGSDESEPVADTHAELARVYLLLKRWDDALVQARWVLSSLERRFGAENINAAWWHKLIGQTLKDASRLEEAEHAYRRALDIREKLLGRDHYEVATVLESLADVLEARGDARAADAVRTRSDQIWDNAVLEGRPEVRGRLNELGRKAYEDRRYEHAESFWLRALEIAERTLPAGSHQLGAALNQAALGLSSLGKYAEAEPLMRRDLEIMEGIYGPRSPMLIISLDNWGDMLMGLQQYERAEAVFTRVLEMRKAAVGPRDRDVAQSLRRLALVLVRRGRHADALPLLIDARSIQEEALGPNTLDVADTLDALGRAYWRLGRHQEAQEALEKAITLYAAGRGVEHADLISPSETLGQTFADQKNWTDATLWFRRSVINSYVAREAVAEEARTNALSRRDRTKIRQVAALPGYLQAVYEEQLADTSKAAKSREETFFFAQLQDVSTASASVTQMAARFLPGNEALADVVRQRQDAILEWLAVSRQLTMRLQVPAARRDGEKERALQQRASALDRSIRDFEDRIRQASGKATVTTNGALPSNLAQAVLLPDEVLIQFVFDKEAGYVWAVTRDDIRWNRVPLGAAALAREVQALRCGLDFSAWHEGEGKACSDLLGVPLEPGSSRGLPFDAERAHRLYRTLFGELEATIKDKHLLIVPSASLATLPLQVLVTDKPRAAMASTAGDYAKVRWLGQRNRMSVLPSIPSLYHSRKFAKTSRATRPFIGFGNPLLLGPLGSDRRAWGRQTCARPQAVAASRRVVPRNAERFTQLFHRGLAKVEDVRRQTPLPETVDELCAVARFTGARPDREVYLGERATEAEIKKLSANGSLAGARIIHFATHGLVAGETEDFATGMAEPALLLTPPTTATEDDDGLLTMSEIARLKLDADWIILSACNTAAGGEKGDSQALSGLAKAFYYAGARALLVSHWYVDSDATVALVTKAFAALKSNPKIGRAEAMRRAMSSMIASAGRSAHPANWAAFVVVGEGAATK